MSITMSQPPATGLAIPAAATRVMLDASDVAAIAALLRELTDRFTTVEDPTFLEEADVIAQELPRHVRQALRRFRLHEPSGALCVLAGWPVDQAKVGPTPSHWKQKAPANRALEEEMLLVLLGSLLGDLIAWSTQQDGRIVHDVLPIRGHEHEQIGTGSEELLTWHVEDAFHPYRGDYVGLLCLRNPDRIPTTFASIGSVDLQPHEAELLREPHFTIRPDESHLPKHGGGGLVHPLLDRAWKRIDAMVRSPEKVPVLFGDLRTPYVRLDPYFMSPVEECPAAQEALDAVTARIDAALEDVVLDPGVICFIDNYQGVHGRRPFRARFDGTDRWLKRINVTRDLRKSRDARESAGSRVLY